MKDSGDKRSQRERMVAGELYVADDPELKAMALRARQLENQFNRSPTRVLLEELLGENRRRVRGPAALPL